MLIITLSMNKSLNSIFTFNKDGLDEREMGGSVICKAVLEVYIHQT